MSKYTDSCTPTTGLQNLSTNYGQSNSRVRSGVERQIDQLLPAVSTGDAVRLFIFIIYLSFSFQLAQEFLAQKARQTAAPSTFNMQSLVARHPPQSSKWADEFANKQHSDRWATEFSANNRFDLRQINADLPSSQWADEFAAQRHPTTMPVRHEEWAKDFDTWLSGDVKNADGSMSAAWTEAQEMKPG
jgi:hypothetical protein